MKIKTLLTILIFLGSASSFAKSIKMTTCLKDGVLKVDCPEVKTFDSLDDKENKPAPKGARLKQLEESVFGLSAEAPVSHLQQPKQKDNSEKVIYGTDDRKEPFQSTDAWKTRARSSVALVSKSRLTDRGSFFSYSTSTFQSSQNMCSSERFSQQYVLPFCTGFLVKPDVIVTAGHCIDDQADCTKTSFVFDFGIYESGSQAPTQILKSKVYSCRRLLGRAYGAGLEPDWAVIQIDRPVCDRDSLPMSQRRATVGTPLVLIGHPAGLPTKIADGANVRTNYTHFFDANLDSYGGNSGSPVFNANTGEILGILVRGETDYVAQNSCRVSNRCSNSGCNGEDVTHIEKVSSFTSQSTCISTIQVISASDNQAAVAPGSIGTIYGRNFLNGSSNLIRAEGPLTEALGSIAVTIGGMPSKIFLVSDTQINIQISPYLSPGDHPIKVTKNSQEIATGIAKVETAAPGLFAFGDIKEGGIANGSAFINRGETQDSLDFADAQGNPNPIPVGREGRTTLVFYGTGLSSSSPSDYEVQIKGLTITPTQVGEVTANLEEFPQFTGMNRLVLVLPDEAAGLGIVDVMIKHLPSGNSSKPVKINLGESF